MCGMMWCIEVKCGVVGRSVVCGMMWCSVVR